MTGPVHSFLPHILTLGAGGWIRRLLSSAAECNNDLFSSRSEKHLPVFIKGISTHQVRTTMTFIFLTLSSWIIKSLPSRFPSIDFPCIPGVLDTCVHSFNILLFSFLPILTEKVPHSCFWHATVCLVCYRSAAKINRIQCSYPFQSFFPPPALLLLSFHSPLYPRPSGAANRIT